MQPTERTISNESIARFRALFAGCERAHGTYTNITQTREDGKCTGRALTRREPVTDELWRKHLAGEQGLGIIPIRDDDTASFGAVDIDVYADLDQAAVATNIARLQLPLIPCRSKSGGIHVYLFAREPVPAAQMVEKLRDVAARLGHGSSEIFPKQTVVLSDSDDLGSWINMPCFAGDRGTRYGIKANGDPMSIAEFLVAAETAKANASAEWIARPLPRPMAALPDGPPCLQHLVEQGIPQGARNKTLFNLAVYCRKAGDGWKDRVQELNQRHLMPPLPHDEVLQVIKSADRKTYFFTCADVPLSQFCNRVQCRGRKLGIGAENRLPTLGSLTKLMTDPPVWFLEVEQGQRLELSTDQLLNPIEFQKRCVESLKGVMVPVVKRNVWTDYLRPAMENVTEIPAPEEMSSGGHFKELLEKYCTEWASALTWEEVHLGHPHTEDGMVYFRLSDFVTFIHRTGHKEYKRQKVALWLRDYGAKHEFRKIGGRGINLWAVPEFPTPEPLPIPETLMNGNAQF
jgi:hypothetical protein